MTTTRQIFIYLGLLVAACVPLNILILRGGGMNGPNAAMLILVLMWAPAVSAILTKLIATRSLKGLGWWPKRFSPLGTAWLAPVIYGGLPFLVAGLVGAGTFTTEAWSKLAVQFGFEASPWIGLALFAGLGTLQSLISATGEEIGWRGFLVPALAEKFGFWMLCLVSGVIWLLYHLPILLFGGYSGEGVPIWYSLVCFTLLVFGITPFVAAQRLRSGSFWPGALLHASHNLFIQGVFVSALIANGKTPWLVGEFGILTPLFLIVLVALYLRVTGVPKTGPGA
jgi:membrane protease YdiL (CAAX protease family)